MPSIASLISSLTERFPALTFTESTDFSWSPEKQTIFYDKTDPGARSLILHELGHAQLQHRDYQRDIQLLGMETDAWKSAHHLARDLGATLDHDIEQAHLDTYRDWLHNRSTCPDCQATGHQISSSQYRCLACLTEWRVNEARTCGLRRYRLNTKTPR